MLTGLDDFQRDLQRLAEAAQSLEGTHSVPLSDLLTPDFLRGCSRFSSIEEFFEASGFKVDSPEDFAAIPDLEWDQFIEANTSFVDWEAMQRDASEQWVARRLDL